MSGRLAVMSHPECPAMPPFSSYDQQLRECLSLAATSQDPLARAVYLAMADEFRSKGARQLAIAPVVAAARRRAYLPARPAAAAARSA